jgi:hypothetical protein
MADGVLVEQRIIDMKYGAARVPPDIFHALVNQCLNDDLGTTEFHLDDLRISAIWMARRAGHDTTSTVNRDRLERPKNVERDAGLQEQGNVLILL